MPRQNLFCIALLGVGLLGAGGAQASERVLIAIDKSSQRMTVSVDGEPRWHWPVSTGRAGHATPAGSFRPFRMEEDHYSEEWDNAPMPHSVFFTRIGHAIHGSYETRRLGTPASAGCVRLAPPHAAQLFALVKTIGLNNTRVVISGTEPVVARRGAPPDVAGTRAPPGVPRTRDHTVGGPPLPEPIIGRRAPEPREPMILSPPPIREQRPPSVWPFNLY
jgi:hypothetical protein